MKNIYKVNFVTNTTLVEAVIIVDAKNLERFVDIMLLKSNNVTQLLNDVLKPISFKDVECEVIGVANDDASDRVVLYKRISLPR